MADKLENLTADQQALLFAVGRQLTRAKIEFVLIASDGAGPPAAASVMSNANPIRAYEMLNAAIVGAVRAAVDPGRVVWEPPLQ
jgi:hypothetical protein